MEKELKWSKLAGIEGLLEKESEDFPGIYVWGFMIQNSFYYYYIGKSHCVHWRLMEHLAHINSGMYSILNIDSINPKYHLETLNNPRSKVYAYIPTDYSGIKKYLVNVKKEGGLFQNKIEKMYQSFRFTVMSLKSFEGEGNFSEILRAAELCTIRDLDGKKRRPNSRGGKPSIEINVNGFWNVTGLKKQ